MSEEVTEEKKEEKKSPSNPGCSIIHEDCDPTLATDKKLPYTSFLVEYMKEGRIGYDITMTSKESDLFDMYYDKINHKTKNTHQRLNYIHLYNQLFV